jgi:hypothetical protein
MFWSRYLGNMDTNVITAISSAAQSTDAHLNWNTVILGFIGLLSTTISGVLAIFMSKISDHTKVSMDNTNEAKTTARDTAVAIETVHSAVNGDRSKMMQEIKTLRDEILLISKQRATLQEQVRETASKQELPQLTDEQVIAVLNARLLRDKKAQGEVEALAQQGKDALAAAVVEAEAQQGKVAAATEARVVKQAKAQQAKAQQAGTVPTLTDDDILQILEQRLRSK